MWVKPTEAEKMSEESRQFREFYDRWSGRVYAFGLKLCRSELLAEELMQEVFLRLWQYRDKLADAENLEAYLFQTVRNQAFTLMKRLAKEEAFLAEYGKDQPMTYNGTEEAVDAREYRRLLEQALAQLTPKQREVYTLCQLEGLTYGQAAERLGVSPLTVKTHMQHALRQVRAFLKTHIDLLVFACLLLP